MIVPRDTPYATDKAGSVRRKMAAASREPRSLHELMAWFRHEFAQEVPGRIHERGVEPGDAIGSPRLAGAYRAYMYGSPLATDHSDALDATTRGAARQRPMHAALELMARKWPLSARFLFTVAWSGADWEDVALAWKMLPEIGHRFTLDALRHLWAIWSRDAVDVAREIA